MIVVVAAIICLIRDKGFVGRFLEWGSFAPGVVPVLAISASYILAGVVGHGAERRGMRLQRQQSVESGARLWEGRFAACASPLK